MSAVPCKMSGNNGAWYGQTITILLSCAGILSGAAMAGPVGAVVGGFVGSALGTVVGVAAGFVGADVRKTLSEHDIFKRYNKDNDLESAVEAERKSDQQNKI